jgi:hypothetical protein
MWTAIAIQRPGDHVTPVDDFPVAVNDTDTTNEDTPVSGSVRGNDTLSGDGGNLISVVDPPNHGTLTLDTAGNFTYTPAATSTAWTALSTSSATWITTVIRRLW